MENKDLLENVSNEELSQDLFELVKKDENKIHDEKFKTKATTFAKDAFKRFCKNKSSVVAAVIIGVLLLGSFLSFLSPHDIRSSHTDQALLTPKLFDTGFGFWDGTKHYLTLTLIIAITSNMIQKMLNMSINIINMLLVVI